MKHLMDLLIHRDSLCVCGLSFCKSSRKDDNSSSTKGNKDQLNEDRPIPKKKRTFNGNNKISQCCAMKCQQIKHTHNASECKRYGKNLQHIDGGNDKVRKEKNIYTHKEESNGGDFTSLRRRALLLRRSIGTPLKSLRTTPVGIQIGIGSYYFQNSCKILCNNLSCSTYLMIITTQNLIQTHLSSKNIVSTQVVEKSLHFQVP